MRHKKRKKDGKRIKNNALSTKKQVLVICSLRNEHKKGTKLKLLRPQIGGLIGGWIGVIVVLVGCWQMMRWDEEPDFNNSLLPTFTPYQGEQAQAFDEQAVCGSAVALVPLPNAQKGMGAVCGISPKPEKIDYTARLLHQESQQRAQSIGPKGSYSQEEAVEASVSANYRIKTEQSFNALAVPVRSYHFAAEQGERATRETLVKRGAPGGGGHGIGDGNSDPDKPTLSAPLGDAIGCLFLCALGYVGGKKRLIGRSKRENETL